MSIIDKHFKNSGFTLVELLIVIAIIAVLAALIFIALNPLQRFRDARNAKRKQDILSIADAIRLYQVSHGGQLPIGLDSNWRMLGADISGCSVSCPGGGGGIGPNSIIDDTQTEFNAGAFSNTQWDNTNSWLELTSAGQSAGTGSYNSSIKDATNTSTSWTTLAWTPQRPLYKELPSNGAAESGYSEGNIDMSGNVLLMRFNESVINHNTVISDSSGNNNNGTAFTNDGAVNKSTIGRFNNAIGLDGLNDYVSISSVPALKYTGGNFSAGSWIRINPTETTIGRIITKPWNSNGGYNYRLELIGNRKIRLFLMGSTTWASQYTYTLNVSEFYHVMFTLDSSRNVKIYINGQEAISQTHNITSWNPPLYGDTDRDLVIGTVFPYKGNWSNPNYNFDGIIDEVAIFTRVLSATEISDMYRRGALRLKYQVRSCDDSACLGETFIGPGGSASAFYSELLNNTAGLPSLSLSNISNNRYFQYQTTLETDNAAYSPEVKSISIGNNISGGSEILQSSCLDLSSLLSSQLPTIPQDPSTGSAGKTYYAIRRQSSGQINVKSCSAEGGESINVAK